MLEEYLEEEQQIMEERTTHFHVLKSNQFMESTISELCQNPINSLEITGTIGEAIQLMQEKEVGSVVILREGELAGIVTERDLLMKVLGKMDNYENRPVSEIMTPDPTYLKKKDNIVYLMNKMYVGGYRHIPILDEENKPIHMVSIRHVLRYFFEFFPEEILNVAPEPYRGPPQREGA